MSELIRNHIINLINNLYSFHVKPNYNNVLNQSITNLVNELPLTNLLFILKSYDNNVYKLWKDINSDDILWFIIYLSYLNYYKVLNKNNNHINNENIFNMLVSKLEEVLYSLKLYHYNDTNIMLTLLRNTIINESTTSPYEHILLDNSNLTIGPCISYHSLLLRYINNLITTSDPKHVYLPGNKKSYMHVTNLQINCPSAFTFCVWIKLKSIPSTNNNDKDTKGFVLYRTRSQCGGVDVLLSTDESVDGRWKVIIRSFREKTPGISTIFKEEVTGYVYIPPNEWHLISVRHTNPLTKSPYVSFIIDGILEWENDLGYPYPTISTPMDSQWILGLGLYGCISSFSLYNEAVDIQLLKLLFEQGSRCHHLSQGIRYPQSSFDSGFITLGTLITKGQLALKAVKASLMFSINTSYFEACQSGNSNIIGLPLISTSYLNSDKIELSTINDSYYKLVKPILSGDCKLIVTPSIYDYFIINNGSSIPLYLLHGYCLLSISNSSNNEDFQIKIRQCIYDTLDMLSFVLLLSGEVREQFVQQHGFHTIAVCLSKLTNKSFYISDKLLLTLINVINCFGMDMKRGDCICACLQGLLLNTSLYESVLISTKIILINYICDITKQANDLLYKYIGLQKIIDFINIYILNYKSNQSIINNDNLSSDYVDLSDSCYRLLLITIESSKIHYTKNKLLLNYSTIIEIIVNCINESTNYLFIDKLIKILLYIKTFSNSTLYKYLYSNRFNETTTISILTSNNYTIDSKRNIFELFLWLAYEECKSITNFLLNHRLDNYKYVDKYIDKLISRYTEKSADLSIDKTIDKYIEKYIDISNLNELSVVVRKFWFLLEELINLLVVTNSTNIIDYQTLQLDYLYDIITFENNNNILICLLLPLLPILFKYTDTTTTNLSFRQKLLMSMNISIKTNENIIETIMYLSIKKWINYFIQLIHLSIYSSIDDYIIIQTEICDCLSTCLELTIDCFSTLFEKYLRYLAYYLYIDINSMTLVDILNHLHSNLSTDIYKRFLLLLFQRIVKSTDLITNSLVKSLCIILNAINNQNIFHNKFFQSQRINVSMPISSHSSTDSLLIVNPNSLINQLSDNENQLINFLLDIFTLLRKIKSKDLLDWQIYIPGYKLVYSCLILVNETVADRICRDFILHCRYLSSYDSNDNTYVTNKLSTIYSDFICTGILNFKFAIESTNISSSIRDRYCACIHAFLHHFHELSNNLSTTKNSNLPNYVIKFIDIFVTINTNNDIFTILYDIEWLLPDIGNTFVDNESTYNERKSDVVSNEILEQKSNETINKIKSIESFENITKQTDKQDDKQSDIIADINDLQWWKTRQGILTDRIDTERVRLTKCIQTNQIYMLSIEKYWRKQRRYIESCIFYDAHDSVWKLGIAHEGPFPGRKRVVLRPIFNNRHDRKQSLISLTSTSNNIVDSLEMSNRLAIALTGNIQDITSNSNEIVDEISHPLINISNGSGWGLVDVDGSEEGYGVIGLANDLDNESNHNIDNNSNNSTKDSISLYNDMMGDVLEQELAMSEGRRLDTGPCRPGTRHLMHGKHQMTSRVILITASGNVWGTLAFNDKEIYFSSSLEPEGGYKDDSANVNVSMKLRMRRRRWAIASIGAIYLRRYRLRDTAVEVFFKRGKHRNFFIDFGYTKENAKYRNIFAKSLMEIAPLNSFKQWPTIPIYRLVSEHNIIDKWLNRDINNFQYLMALNTIGGRSYNDLCQYPIMPWILCQYSESIIDLSDTSSYRDLSKPMGALNPTRLQEFLSRYNSFINENIDLSTPAFMYGSHYSTMVGVVLHYLIRLEPFASLHCEMQNGRFDISDRLFSSIIRSWNHNTTQLSEVKELTPEWFTLPSMFRNVNGYDYGVTQDGQSIDNVELPKWCQSPEQFISIHREALESNYVSNHLHEWIDLIFGYKQQGPAAIEANNVFYYLTYYGTVNRDKINDEALRKAIELQIAHFGQMPYQLFKTPHPMRKTLYSNSNIDNTKSEDNKDKSKVIATTLPRLLQNCFNKPTVYPLNNNLINSQVNWMTSYSLEQKLIVNSNCACFNIKNTVITILILIDRLVAILSDGVIEIFKYGTSDYVKQIIVQNTKKTKQKRSIVTDTQIDEHLVVEETLPPQIAYDDDLPMALSADYLNIDITNQSANISNNPKNFISESTIYFTKEDCPTDQTRCLFSKTTNFLHSVEGYTGAMHYPILTSNLLHFTTANKLFLTIGYTDGRIIINEIDSSNALIKSSSTFTQHKSEVIAISSDGMPSSTTDVIVSCDRDGIILLWAISKVRINNDDTTQCIIFRYPQRIYHIWVPSIRTNENNLSSNVSICCDVSSLIGIIVVIAAQTIHVFSMERDEKITAFTIDPQPLNLSKFDSNKFICKHLSLSDEGYINIHNSLYSSDHQLISDYLITYSLLGDFCSMVCLNFAISSYICPGHGDTVIIGSLDGTIEIYDISTLYRLSTIQPHVSCYQLDNNSKQINSNKASPIISISVGPNPLHPSIITASTLSGDIYIRPLPDFINWERNRNPSVLSQIVSGHIQAVKGTIQQAHNYISSTTDTIAQNARQYADEQLKKINKTSLWRGVGNFLGLSKDKDKDGNT